MYHPYSYSKYCRLHNASLVSQLSRSAKESPDDIPPATNSHVRAIFRAHDHRPTTWIFNDISSQQEHYLHIITCSPFHYLGDHGDSEHNLIVGRIGCDGGTASCRHAGRSTFTPLMQHDHLKSRSNLPGSSMNNSTRAPRFDVERAVNLRLCGLNPTDGRD